MAYDKIIVPRAGTKITINDDQSLNVPNHPIIPFIEGDGIGIDIIPVMKKVVDSAVQKAYGNQRKIYWMEVYCGEKASKIYEGNYFPEETIEALNEFIVSIKGPLATPIDTVDLNRVEVAGLEQEKKQDGLLKNQVAKNEIEKITPANIYQLKVYSADIGNDIPVDIHKNAGQNKVNPLPIILSAKAMLCDLGWTEASQLIAKGIQGAIAKKMVTYDFESMSEIMSEMMSELTLEDATIISCTAFGDIIVKEM